MREVLVSACMSSRVAITWLALFQTSVACRAGANYRASLDHRMW